MYIAKQNVNDSINKTTMQYKSSNYKNTSNVHF